MKLSEEIVKHFGDSLYRTASYIILGGARVTIGKAEKEGILEVLPSLRESLPEDLRSKVDTLSRGQKIDLSLKLLPLVKEKKKTSTDLPKELEEGLKSCILVAVDKEFVFFDTKRRTILDTSADMILERFTKKDRDSMKREAKIGRAVFDAHDLRPLKTEVVDGFIQTSVMNLHKPPLWREKFPKADPVWNKELPPLLDELITNICSDEDSKEAMLLWMAQAVTSKNETFLQLRGSRGNGKTTLAYVLMAIIGNSTVARDGLDRDGFNGYLRNKRAVLIDDDPYFGSYKYNTKRKNLINSKKTYNSKGKAIGDEERHYTNYIVASNLADSFYVDYDERRMNYINLVTKKLENWMTQEKISFLRGVGESVELTDLQLEFLAQAGHFFLEYGKGKEDKILALEDRHTDLFWNDVIVSLGEVKRATIERAIAGDQEYIAFASIKAECSDDKTRFASLANFCRSFKYKNNAQLFIEVDDKAKTFKVNPVFLKEQETETFDEDFEIENL